MIAPVQSQSLAMWPASTQIWESVKEHVQLVNISKKALRIARQLPRCACFTEVFSFAMLDFLCCRGLPSSLRPSFLAMVQKPLLVAALLGVIYGVALGVCFGD